GTTNTDPKAMEEETLVFNGINGASGQYLLPPLTTADISKLARGETLDKVHLQELLQRYEQISQSHFGVREMTQGDATNLARTGWGVIFARDADPAIREALAPLLDHRRQQAAREKEKYYQEYTGVRACSP